MKNLPISIIVTILWIGAALHLQADSPSPIVTLKTQLQKACETRDLNAIKLCYDFEGVPPALVDMDMNVWQEYFNDNDKTSHWVFEKVAYMSLDQARTDKTINQKSTLSMTEPRNMNGTAYEPNLKVIGFITTSFKQGPMGAGTMQPVGIAKDGTARLVMSRPIK